MATFDGFDDPKENWSKLPHNLIDALPIIETVSEFKVIVYILRHTWGYQDDEKRITQDEFANGRKRKDGSRIDQGTGLTIPSIRDGLKRAIKHGFIEHRQDARDKARVKNFYTLKMRVGEKPLPPECKEDSPRGKNSLPRSEKETLERNPRKETERSGEKTPSPPPTHDPGYLPDAETQINLLLGASRPGIADPFQDVEHYMQTSNDWLQVVKDRTGYWPEINVQKPAILELVKQPNADLKFWSQVVTAWVGLGWNKRNITGMIEYYARGEIPRTGRNGGTNATNRRRNSGTTVPGQVPAPNGFGSWDAE